MIINIISNSPLQTQEIGKIFSKVLATNDIILLDGELGAGKTTFISGIAEGFGVKESLSSPSFTILNIYTVNRKKKLVHADFYRLDNIDEILGTGIEDYLYTKDKYIFIEWGSKIRSYLKTDCIEIEFNYILKSEHINGYVDQDPEQVRSIAFKSESKYWGEKLVIFKKLLTRNALNV